MLAHTTQDVKLKDGRVIHYGPPGCSPTPPLTRNFWTSSLPGVTGSEVSAAAAGGAGAAAPVPAGFRASPLSAYTTVQHSIKGGVGVPVGSDAWLQKQVGEMLT